MKQYFLLMRFHKPIGLFLLLWPTLWGLWIAGQGFPSTHVLLVFIFGVILMRSAGCAINDFADRNFDKAVARTQYRPLTAGKIKSYEAIIIFLVLSLSAFLMVLTLNSLTIYLACAAAIIIFLYPFMKRYTHLPQFILGVAFAWGIPMAFAAETGKVANIAWFIVFITILWVIVYDTMYALVDRADDVKIGLKSTAILFGTFAIFIIMLLQCIIIILFVLLGWMLNFKIIYFIGVTFAAALFLYQQHLLRQQTPQSYLRAFVNNNWVGCSIFLGVFLNFLHR